MQCVYVYVLPRLFFPRRCEDLWGWLFSRDSCVRVWVCLRFCGERRRGGLLVSPEVLTGFGHCVTFMDDKRVLIECRAARPGSTAFSVMVNRCNARIDWVMYALEVMSGWNYLDVELGRSGELAKWGCV